MFIADSILVQDIEPSERNREALMAAARLGGPRLQPQDVQWARWLAREMEALLDGYRQRRAQRLSLCGSDLQRAAVESIFRLATEPLAREHAALLQRIALAGLDGPPTNVVALPPFLPRRSLRR